MNHVKTLCLVGKFFYATLAVMIVLSLVPIAGKIVDDGNNPAELSIINSDQLVKKSTALNNRSKHQQIEGIEQKGQSQSFQKASIRKRTPSVLNPFHLKKKLSDHGSTPVMFGKTAHLGVDEVNDVRDNRSAPDTVWTKTFGGIGNEYGNSVQQTFDGGYIITGYTYSYGQNYALLIKTDAFGDMVWTQTFSEGEND